MYKYQNSLFKSILHKIYATNLVYKNHISYFFLLEK